MADSVPIWSKPAPYSVTATSCPYIGVTKLKNRKRSRVAYLEKGNSSEVYNRVKQRFAVLRRTAGTSATPTKAEIIRIKKTGETPTEDRPLWTHRESKDCDSKAMSLGE